jgi:hypothetical protein
MASGPQPHRTKRDGVVAFVRHLWNNDPSPAPELIDNEDSELDVFDQAW